MKKEVYVSIDIEATGPVPGPYSMLSLGAAAFIPGTPNDRTPIATFEVNLQELPGADWHPDTLEWWKKFPDALAHATTGPIHPEEAMFRLDAWTRSLPGKPVMVVYPTWDYLWVYWYLMRFLGQSPFGLAALDIKSFAFQRVAPPRRGPNPSFHATSKKNMPKWWFEGDIPHTHKALDDAIGQGVIFINIMRDIGRTWPSVQKSNT